MNPIVRNIARGLVILAALLVTISMLAQLTGCHVTRAVRTADAPTTLPADGRHQGPSA